MNVDTKGSGNYNDDVLTLQSTLRELEKKIQVEDLRNLANRRRRRIFSNKSFCMILSQLETVHYEELMLELTLSKKHEKVKVDIHTSTTY